MCNPDNDFDVIIDPYNDFNVIIDPDNNFDVIIDPDNDFNVIINPKLKDIILMMEVNIKTIFNARSIKTIRNLIEKTGLSLSESDTLILF